MCMDDGVLKSQQSVSYRTVGHAISDVTILATQINIPLLVSDVI